MAEEKIPTASLTILNPDAWEAEAHQFALQLIEEGKRPWFKLFWPTPVTALADGMTDEEWQDRQENLNGEGTYDAIELIDGEFVTVPPFSELIEES